MTFEAMLGTTARKCTDMGTERAEGPAGVLP